MYNITKNIYYDINFKFVELHINFYYKNNYILILNFLIEI